MFSDCPPWAQKNILTQIKKKLWWRSGFPGIWFTKDYEIKEEVAKRVMAWHYIYCKASLRVTWEGSVQELLTLSKKKQEEVLQRNPEGFDRVESTTQLMFIKGSKGGILALRIPIPPEFVKVLRDTDCCVPQKANTNTNAEAPADPHSRGSHAMRHYALWADRSKHPYLSKDMREDGEACEKWVENNSPLFR